MIHIVLEKPGRFVTQDRPEPSPSPGTALVRVRRIGVCGTDLHAFAGRQPFFTYPRILGHELGVEIVDPGEDPGELRAGDRCSVEPYLNCGRCIACRRGKPNCCEELRVLGVHIDGGMTPLIRVPARKLHSSRTLDFDQLALVEALGIGARAVERAAPRPDEFAIVVGAGPIGLGVIQFAKIRCGKLAVIDISETRLGFCREQLGISHTLVPGDQAVDELRAIGNGDLPTCVFDATGNPKSMAATFGMAANGGRIVFVGLFQGELSFSDPEFHRKELTLMASRNSTPGTFRDVIARVESGEIDTRPWITHRLALADVPEAFPRDIADNPSVLKAMIEVR